MTLVIAAFSIFLLNLPFGYWRANVKKLSFQWFLAIHIPIPFIILMRLTTDIGFAWTSYLFTILTFFLGQATGKRIYKYIKTSGFESVTSCMIMDLFRILKIEKRK